MRLAYVLFTVLLVLGLTKGDLLSQFKVIPKVELNILFENGCQSFPGKIVLIGFGKDNEDKIYRLHTTISKGKYIIYDVEPGMYLVAFSLKENNEERGVFAQFERRSYYDEVNGFFGCQTTIKNEIEVRHNRNLKLDIVFSRNSFGLGFKKGEEKKLIDFDYTRLTYFSKMSDNILDINEIQGNNLNDRERKEPFSDEISDNTSQCYGICGEPGGSCDVRIDHECKLDGGNITVKIRNAVYKNSAMEVVTAGTEGVGVQDPLTKKWTNGITVVQVAMPDWCEDPDPQNCDKPKVTYSCDKAKKKCQYMFEYDLRIEMKILVWDPIEMCSTLKNIDVSGNNYNLNIPSPSTNRNCCWFHNSVKIHEWWHCKQWLEASDKLSGELCESLSRKKYTANECCEKDDECKKQAETLKYLIYVDITRYMQQIFQESNAGDYQETKCYVEQYKHFLKNKNKPCNLN